MFDVHDPTAPVSRSLAPPLPVDRQRKSRRPASDTPSGCFTPEEAEVELESVLMRFTMSQKEIIFDY